MLHVYQPFEANIPQLFEFDVHNKIHYEDTTYSLFRDFGRCFPIFEYLLQIITDSVNCLKIIAKLLKTLINLSVFRKIALHLMNYATCII